MCGGHEAEGRESMVGSQAGARQQLSTPERGSRGRPFDTRVRADLLHATRELLVEVGYDRLTIEAVAKRCGAGKAAVYRRWAGKPDLVMAAAFDRLPELLTPDTGDLRSDLLEAGRVCVGDEGRSQVVMSIVLAAGRHHPNVQEMALDLLDLRVEKVFVAVLTRGRARGAVAAGVDIGILSEIVPVIAFHRAAVFGEAMDDVQLTRIVDSVLLPAVLR